MTAYLDDADLAHFGDLKEHALEQGLTMKHLGEAIHAAASLRAGITLAHGLVAHNIDKKVSM